jgi:hypothetical protein
LFDYPAEKEEAVFDNGSHHKKKLISMVHKKPPKKFKQINHQKIKTTSKIRIKISIKK